MKTYTYYPGCSVKGTAQPYETSLKQVFEALELKLEELPDWNCCGATFYISVDETASFVLSSRNLALAEQLGRDIVAPCSACYLTLLKTQDYIQKYPQIRQKVDAALTAAKLTYSGTVKVRHPLEVLFNDVGLDALRNRTRSPLRSFKVAPYYGCQIVRPFQQFDDATYPETMDQLLTALGAEVIDYPVKTRCCGGSLTGTITDVGLRLNYILLKEAQERGANCIVTVCPLCQFNLEAYQKKIIRQYKELTEIPIFYFTQLIGLAFGLQAQKLGLNKHIISPKKLVQSLHYAQPTI
ncbi:MAG: CoB--CoM heterodisulfide reductase iron-sulfur subunit B family protein [Caldisericaceae bacterium]|nr:CoB--CoM heterodisulfide reductase iron-sulfur subunit B family protein [Caldisericaceae bacterium]